MKLRRRLFIATALRELSFPIVPSLKSTALLPLFLVAAASWLLPLFFVLGTSCEKAQGTGSGGGGTTLQLLIEGMDCDGCAQTARKTLERIDGVRSATVSFQRKTAAVVCDSARVTPEALVTAIENIVVEGRKQPFRASVLPTPSEGR